jgi:hypothetical protein
MQSLADTSNQRQSAQQARAASVQKACWPAFAPLSSSQQRQQASNPQYPSVSHLASSDEECASIGNVQLTTCACCGSVQRGPLSPMFVVTAHRRPAVPGVCLESMQTVTILFLHCPSRLGSASSSRLGRLLEAAGAAGSREQAGDGVGL